MKKYFLLAGLLAIVATAAQAQESTPTKPSEKKMIIKFKEGKWDTTYVDRDNSDSESESESEFESDMEEFKEDMKELKKELKNIKPKSKGVDKNYFYLDLGFNSLLQNGSLDLTGNNSPLSLNQGFNSFGWGFSWARSENIIAQKLRLQYGLGFEFNNYSLRRDSSIQIAGDTVGFTAAGAGLTRNRLNVNYINFPVLLQFSSNPYKMKRSLNIAIGGELGIRLGRMSSYQTYNLPNEVTQRVTTSGALNANPLKLSLIGRVGYGKTDLFVRYSLTELFEQNVNVNPNATPVMVGLSFRM
jgi:opacity protein-like surface antigen